MQRPTLALFVFAFLVLPACLDPPQTPPPDAPAPAPYETFLAGPGPLTNASRSFSPVNFLVTPTGGPANELVIAVNPRDPLNLIAGAKDYALGTDHPCTASGDGPTYPVNVWSGVYWSRDGGRTWKNALMPGHPADDANSTHPNRAWPCNSDPVVVFDEEGLAYYSGLGIRGPSEPDPTHPCLHRNRSVWLMKSRDGGETWTDFSCVDATSALAPVAGEVIDKQWFAVDGLYVYFSYVEFNPSELDLKFKRSTDRGLTWDPETVLIEAPTPETPDSPVGGRQFTMPAVGAGGAVFVIWRSFGSDDGVYMVRSFDNGATFDEPRRIFAIDGLPGSFEGADYRTNSIPVLATDRSDGPNSGNLYIAWPDYRDGDSDIRIARSSDDGETWKEWNLHQDRPEVDGTHQFLPWMVVSPTGHVHVAWLDSRNTKNATSLDVYYTASLDGGETWSPEKRLTAQPLETASCGHQSGADFIGDYIGLAASSVAVHPFWPDGRGGKCNGMTATLLR